MPGTPSPVGEVPIAIGREGGQKHLSIMIAVTCAVIRNEEDEVLVVQHGEATDHPFKWEFPGGKLADGLLSSRTARMFDAPKFRDLLMSRTNGV